jgi:DNA-directed RNA polymerase sigma subunit (sigma70/sigma32)
MVKDSLIRIAWQLAGHAWAVPVDGFEATLEQVMADVLTEREREAIALRFGFNGKPCSQSEAARQMGISRERVRQLENRAMNKLRRPAAWQRLMEHIWAEIPAQGGE